ncbi:hypothetical protein SC81_23245, partial [Vibrio vulnificus]
HGKAVDTEKGEEPGGDEDLKKKEKHQTGTRKPNVLKKTRPRHCENLTEVSPLKESNKLRRQISRHAGIRHL